MREPELKPFGFGVPGDWYYRRYWPIGMLALLALVITVQPYLMPFGKGIPVRRPQFIVTFDVIAIWSMVLADWIAKRRWLKRHPEIRDFPLPHILFPITLLAFMLAGLVPWV